MLIFASILLFLFGLTVGSFINMLIYRMENKKRKSVFGRSFCPHCENEIKAYDLVPVLSWVLLNGCCRSCKKKISVQYPLVELSTAFIFSLIGYFFLYLGSFSAINIINTIFWLFFASCLMIIFVYDLKHRIIPNGTIYTVTVASLLYLVLISFLTDSYSYLLDHALSGLFAFFFFWAVAFLGEKIFKKTAMGGGDIKLATFMGFILGWQGTVVALYFSFIISACFGVLLIVLGKKKMTSQIPFGPFMVAGTFFGLFWSGQIISFYVNMFM